MLTVIKPFCNEFHRENRMDQILSNALAGIETEYLLTAKEIEACDLRGRKILFAVCLSEAGINLEYYRILEYFRRESGCLTGCCGAVIVDGSGELFTKSLARRLVFSANAAGCAFIGRPLVEATGSLYNFKTMSKVLETDLQDTYQRLTERLIKRLLDFEMLKIRHPKVLAVHASSRKTSNSLLLWEKIKNQLDTSIEVTEISLRNGQMLDCRGCKYEECMHFGERGGCFYGGIMVEQVYPAIIECDCLVMICPNYNDAVSANITAFINRLTAVFRTHDFSKKKIFALVVSGYSGGDIVAEQIISAMNFNKNFILPAKFAMVETANDPGSILEVEGIDEKAGAFARKIRA
ncbi:NADPH-dependent FMN reductase [uncultured Eubacterium sp.]|nr:NADPH-dependent FMN reductase [uncultured Eubacterium sp.]